MTRFTARDILERVFWTFVAGALANVVGSVLLDVEVWKAAVMAGFAAVMTYVLAFARWRLAVLPDPANAVALQSRADALAEVEAMAAPSAEVEEPGPEGVNPAATETTQTQ